MTDGWRRYEERDRDHWNAFAAGGPEGSFLFHRDFMEYHRDRFEDASLIYFADGKIAAALPASKGPEGEVISHQGLTFGGPLFGASATLEQKTAIMSALAPYLKLADSPRAIFKPIPAAFKPRGDQDLDFVLHTIGATLFRRDLNAVIWPGLNLEVQERRVRGAKKALKYGVKTATSADFAAFWNQILLPVLTERHGVKPTHTLEEIEKLARRFDQIRLEAAFVGDQMIAGVVTFEYPHCTHAQYIAANDEGRKANALDLIFQERIAAAKAAGRGFSFGISTEEAGRKVNFGLLEWKLGFGASLVTHDHYELR